MPQKMFFSSSATCDKKIMFNDHISIAHKSKRLLIQERFCLTSSLIPDCDCNSTLSAGIYFRPIIFLQFEQFLFTLLQKCKKF